MIEGDLFAALSVVWLVVAAIGLPMGLWLLRNAYGDEADRKRRGENGSMRAVSLQVIRLYWALFFTQAFALFLGVLVIAELPWSGWAFLSGLLLQQLGFFVAMALDVRLQWQLRGRGIK